MLIPLRFLYKCIWVLLLFVKGDSVFHKRIPVHLLDACICGTLPLEHGISVPSVFIFYLYFNKYDPYGTNRVMCICRKVPFLYHDTPTIEHKQNNNNNKELC
jgi:hypothetical protein